MNFIHFIAAWANKINKVACMLLTAACICIDFLIPLSAFYHLHFAIQITKMLSARLILLCFLLGLFCLVFTRDEDCLPSPSIYWEGTYIPKSHSAMASRWEHLQVILWGIGTVFLGSFPNLSDEVTVLRVFLFPAVICILIKQTKPC